MSIIKDALQKQIVNQELQQVSDTTATILDYDIVSHTATIRFSNPNGEGYLTRKNVSISNTMGGVTGSGIFAGQTCSISFIKKNIFNPIIVGMFSNHYESKRTTDEGAFLVDSAIKLVKKPSVIKPMIEEWITENETDASKFNNDLGDYTFVDASKESNNIIHGLDRYGQNENGITNLETRSTVKLKDNGDIDIFVANNVGIRISPTDKSINIYGTFKINNEVIDFDNDIKTKE